MRSYQQIVSQDPLKNSPQVAYDSLYKYYSIQPHAQWISPNYTTTQDNTQKIAWFSSEQPRWNDYMVKLEKYEAYYGVDSKEMIDEYKHGKSNDIPKDQLSDWLQAYSLYWT